MKPIVCERGRCVLRGTYKLASAQLQKGEIMRTQRCRTIVIGALLGILAAGAIAVAQDSPKSEQDYIAVLQSEAPSFQKARACQRLAVVGTKKAVPTLAALLDDETLGDYARLAMEPIEDPSVDNALRKAMGRLRGRQLAGVVNSIGVRRDAGAVSGLKKLVHDPGSGVATEALAALGQIATDDAVVTLRKILTAGPAKLRRPAADACLMSAQRLSALNKHRQAMELYDTIRKGDVDGYLRSAATYGAIRLPGAAGLQLLIEQLKTTDPAMVEVALRAARQLPGPEVTRTLAAELPGLHPVVQVLAIKALVDRKDVNVRKSIQTLAAGDNPLVRAESLKALGKIGDASSVPVLLKAARNDNAEAKIALAGLRILDSEGVDPAILTGMKAANGKLRADLIAILTDRRYTAATGVLLEEAASEDKATASAAFKALGILAAPEHMPAIVELLAGLRSNDVRSRAENAVVAVAVRIEDRRRRADDVLAMLNSTDRIDVRCSLLRVLGRIANDKALDVLRKGLKDSDAQVRDTSVRAIAAWPDSKALDVLSDMSADTTNNTHRVLAFRGYLRLLGLDRELSEKAKVKLYTAAMNSVVGSDEKKLVLGGLAGLRDPGALKIIMDHIDDPAVKDEAVVAAMRVAQAIAGARPADAREAAQRIKKKAASSELRDQAGLLIKTVNGFDDSIVAWQVAGPYTQGSRDHSQLFDIAFAPETAAGDVKWSLMPAGTDPKRPWILDLLKLYPGDSRAAYVRTWIHSEKKQAVVLEMGSDDGVKAWLNGKLVHAHSVARAAVPGTDKANITLEQGANILMLKITQNVGPWEFCVRMRKGGGGKVEGIEIDCFQEEP